MRSGTYFSLNTVLCVGEPLGKLSHYLLTYSVQFDFRGGRHVTESYKHHEKNLFLSVAFCFEIMLLVNTDVSKFLKNTRYHAN
jgi:hypothetical protein